MSDTPRTDKATWDVDDCGKPTDRRDGTGYPTGYWVITDFARTLERELSAMQHRAESAEIIAERNIAELAKLNALPLAPAFTREDACDLYHMAFHFEVSAPDHAAECNDLAARIEQAAGGE